MKALSMNIIMSNLLHNLIPMEERLPVQIKTYPLVITATNSRLQGIANKILSFKYIFEE